MITPITGPASDVNGQIQAALNDLTAETESGGTAFYDKDYANLAAAISAIGSTVADLIISSAIFGDGNANNTVPSTLTLRFVGAGSLTLTTGKTTTIKSSGRYWPERKIFYNALASQGTISFSGKASGDIYFQWWGAVGDNFVTDDAAPVQACVTAAAGRPVRPTARFGIGSTITATGPVSIVSDHVIGNGANPEPAFGWIGAANGILFSFTGTQYLQFKGFAVDMKAGANSGATAFKWDTTGPESRISFENMVLTNSAINSNTKLFYSSATSSANNENVSFKYVQAFASSSASPTGSSRGYCYYQGVNANAIDITFDHTWFRSASVAMAFRGGQGIAIRDGFLMESNTAIETAVDLTVENMRFENNGQWLKVTGGGPTIKFDKNMLGIAGLAAPTTPTFDMSASGGTIVTMTNNLTDGVTPDAAQIIFSATGGSLLVSENNLYPPTTTNLNISFFSNYRSCFDFNFSPTACITKASTGVEFTQDDATGLDGLTKFSQVGKAEKMRIGPVNNRHAYLFHNYYLNALSSNAKDTSSESGWAVDLGTNNSDAGSHFQIVYVPAGSTTPSSAFLDIDGNGVVAFGGPAKLKSYMVSTLPTGAVGMIACVTDGDAALAWGATVVNSGSGATKYQVWFNGTNWTVTGK